MIEIKNKNFISPKMQFIDICKAFEKPKQGVQNFIYDVLIPEGYLRKANERYYSPTEKLLDLAFLPKQLILAEWQARFLSYNQFYSLNDLIQVFDDNEQIAKCLVRQGKLLLQKNGAYAKSAKFEEALAEGESQFLLADSNIERR